MTTDPQSDGVTGSASVTSAANLFDVDTGGYDSIIVQVTNAGVGCTISYEGSNDGGVTWLSLLMLRIDNAGANSNGVSSTTTGLFLVPALTKRVRARVSTYGSGTVASSYVLKSVQYQPINSIVVNGGGAIPVTATIAPTSNSGFAATKARVAALATTNPINLKGSSGVLYSVDVDNNTAAAKFFKLYDKATAPVVGTDTPAFTFIIPANGTLQRAWAVGLAFTLGIGYGITGAIADADTTAVAANDVHGVIGWK